MADTDLYADGWHENERGELDFYQRDVQRTRERRGAMTSEARYVVQVWNGKAWRKVRGPEGGPWRTRERAERIATGRELSERRTSSTEGMPHRVVEAV